MEAHVFIAQSLDGYIADNKGSIDFLKMAELSDEDYGYGEFMAKTECIVMGRKTWETVRAFGFWPYAHKNVVVMSKDKHSPIADEQFFSGSVTDLWSQLKSQNKTYLYVDGGQVIQSFLREGLISTLTITTLPILLGGGTRLFSNLTEPMLCKLEKITPYPNGVSQAIYATLPK